MEGILTKQAFRNLRLCTDACVGNRNPQKECEYAEIRVDQKVREICGVQYFKGRI